MPFSVFGLGQGVAVGVVAVGGVHPVENAVGAVAHLVELVLGAVVAVNRVGDGLTGQVALR